MPEQLPPSADESPQAKALATLQACFGRTGLAILLALRELDPKADVIQITTGWWVASRVLALSRDGDAGEQFPPEAYRGDRESALKEWWMWYVGSHACVRRDGPLGAELYVARKSIVQSEYEFEDRLSLNSWRRLSLSDECRALGSVGPEQKLRIIRQLDPSATVVQAEGGWRLKSDLSREGVEGANPHFGLPQETVKQAVNWWFSCCVYHLPKHEAVRHDAPRGPFFYRYSISEAKWMQLPEEEVCRIHPWPMC